MVKAGVIEKRKPGARVKITQTRSLMYCMLAYVAAWAVAVLLVWALPPLHPLATAALADLAATLVIFIFSLLLNNSSLYDPYWSVAPVFLAGYWLSLAWASGTGTGRELPALLRDTLVLALLFFWAIRLTVNWIRRWQGLQHEDWRYAGFRHLPAAGYWLVSFFGFHLMPTCLVFAGCIPLYFIFNHAPGQLYGLDLAACLVTVAAIWLESRADTELRNFIKENKEPGKIFEQGLWAYSRHPNYCGEVLFWWGIFLFGWNVADFPWWSVAGPAGITSLFLFISIPLMDKHMLRKHPAYQEHIQRRSAFIPWFRKQS